MVCCVQGYTAFRERSGSVIECDSRPRGRGFKPQRRHCLVSLSKTYNPILVLVQFRKTRPYIAERLVMGRKESNHLAFAFITNRPYIAERLVMGCKESNQTNKYTAFYTSNQGFAVTTYFHYNKGYHCKALIFEA